MKAKVLVIDDDAKLRSVIRRWLGANAFAVIESGSGGDALLLARESRPDLVLSDVAMPGLDGRALCRVLRKDPALAPVPIILMSGSIISDQDILAGFEGGADDYVLKPFSLAVLQARIEAVLRRYRAPAEGADKLKRCGLALDPLGRTVGVRGRPVALTRKEFDLLACLVAKTGRVLSVPYLLESVWGYDPADYNDPGTVEVHVSHLRKKLGPALAKRIVNHAGLGYKFDA